MASPTARKPTLSEIRTFLTELGLGANPIERITHHRDGSATIWVVGLARPVKRPAPCQVPVLRHTLSRKRGRGRGGG